jgi:hypothetical protein
MKKFRILFLGIILAGLSACEIDDADKRSLEMQPTLGITNIAVIYGTTEAHGEEVDIYADNDIILTAAFGDMTDGYVRHKYPQGSLFRVVTAGVFPTFGLSDTHHMMATAAELLPETHNVPLQGQLKKDGHYTLFLGEELGFITPFLVEDDLTPPPAGSIKVRFVNLSWETGGGGGGPVDFVTTADGVLATLNFYENPVSEFITMPAGNLDASVFDEGTADLVYDIPAVTTTGGNIYTIVLMGRDLAGDPEAYTHRIFQNN